MGYFQVRYDSRVVNYDRRGFIRLATGVVVKGEAPDTGWTYFRIKLLQKFVLFV